MIELTLTDLAFAWGAIAIAISFSFWQRLGLEWQLLIASFRTIFQLLFVGYILAIVFEADQPLFVLAILGVMLTIAAIVARNRISQKVPKLFFLVWGSILTSTALTIGYTNFVVIKPEVWYEPQYLIPLAGMVLGNSMNAAAISGERLVSTINASPLEIETYLSLGAMPKQAVEQYRKDAVKAGLIPTINAMMVVGIVTLPGIITGQLLTGVNPLVAATYQILIMFMLALGNLTTALLVTGGLCRQFFNSEQQLQKF